MSPRTGAEGGCLQHQHTAHMRTNTVRRHKQRKQAGNRPLHNCRRPFNACVTAQLHASCTTGGSASDADAGCSKIHPPADILPDQANALGNDSLTAGGRNRDGEETTGCQREAVCRCTTSTAAGLKGSSKHTSVCRCLTTQHNNIRRRVSGAWYLCGSAHALPSIAQYTLSTQLSSAR